MSKKSQQQGNIAPFSISAISNNPDISSVSFAGLFDDKKVRQQSGDYKIKVKKAYDNNANRSQGLVQTPTKNNIGIRMIHEDIDNIWASQSKQQPIITAQQIPLTPTTTGYQICKTSFSEQQILQAFKVMDINKDEVITEQDIMFFLEYIKQPYTQQQVKQMINMISSDGKKVTLQQFKKIGKGTIIPFADIKVPDEIIKQKKIIYENIVNNQSLYQENPSIIISASQTDIISQKKFQDSKKASTFPILNQDIDQIDEEEQIDFIAKYIPLLSEKQFQNRRQVFSSLQMVNVTQVARNYFEIESKIKPNTNSNIKLQTANIDQQNQHFIDNKGISKMLQISQKQAKLLYPQSSPTLTKRVALQAIAYSQLNKIKKLQLGMNIMLKKKTINCNELYFILQILKSRDDSGSLKKKLLTVLKSKRISTDEQIDKFYVLELINTYSYQFNF